MEADPTTCNGKHHERYDINKGTASEMFCSHGCIGRSLGLNHPPLDSPLIAPCKLHPPSHQESIICKGLSTKDLGVGLEPLSPSHLLPPHPETAPQDLQFGHRLVPGAQLANRSELKRLMACRWRTFQKAHRALLQLQGSIIEKTKKMQNPFACEKNYEEDRGVEVPKTTSETAAMIPEHFTGHNRADPEFGVLITEKPATKNLGVCPETYSYTQADDIRGSSVQLDDTSKVLSHTRNSRPDISIIYSLPYCERPKHSVDPSSAVRQHSITTDHSRLGRSSIGSITTSEVGSFGRSNVVERNGRLDGIPHANFCKYLQEWRRMITVNLNEVQRRLSIEGYRGRDPTLVYSQPVRSLGGTEYQRRVLGQELLEYGHLLKIVRKRGKELEGEMRSLWTVMNLVHDKCQK